MENGAVYLLELESRSGFGPKKSAILRANFISHKEQKCLADN